MLHSIAVSSLNQNHRRNGLFRFCRLQVPWTARWRGAPQCRGNSKAYTQLTIWKRFWDLICLATPASDNLQVGEVADAQVESNSIILLSNWATEITPVVWMPRYAMKYTSSTQGQQHVCHAKPLFDNVLRSVAERLAPQCSKDRVTVGVNIIYKRFCQAIDTSCTQRWFMVFFQCLDVRFTQIYLYRCIYRYICCKSTTVSYTCKYKPILSCTCKLAQLPQVPTCVCNLAFLFQSMC